MLLAYFPFACSPFMAASNAYSCSGLRNRVLLLISFTTNQMVKSSQYTFLSRSSDLYVGLHHIWTRWGELVLYCCPAKVKSLCQLSFAPMVCCRCLLVSLWKWQQMALSSLWLDRVPKQGFQGSWCVTISRLTVVRVTNLRVSRNGPNPQNLALFLCPVPDSTPMDS